jgi:hypothetical protein
MYYLGFQIYAIKILIIRHEVYTQNNGQHSLLLCAQHNQTKKSSPIDAGSLKRVIVNLSKIYFKYNIIVCIHLYILSCFKTKLITSDVTKKITFQIRKNGQWF